MKILEAYQVGKGVLLEMDAGLVNLTSTIKQINENIEKMRDEGKFDPNTRIIVEAILQKANVLNKNGRIYPYDILDKEQKRYVDLLKTNSAVGESNHPESTNIDLNNISHRILELGWDGSTLMGKLELHVSPGYLRYGYCSPNRPADNIYDDIRRGVQIGISSRGIGSVTEHNGQNIVQEDFELICWDLVNSPSTPGAYLLTQKEQKLKESVVIKESVKPKIFQVTKEFLK